MTTIKSQISRWMTKAEAILRRGAPSLRNFIFAQFGYWPVDSMRAHWLESLPVYCISLSRADWRRKIIRQQVDAMGLSHFQFVDAIDARSLTAKSVIDNGQYDPERSLLWHERGLSLTEIACSLSHAECYRLIVQAGHERALIIEDDALFRCSRLRRLRLDEIPDWADLVFLNAFLEKSSPERVIGGMVYSDFSYNGSAAGYMVTLKCATKLLTEAVPVVHAADGLLGRALRHEETANHAFRGRGSDLGLQAVIIYPEAITNGSTEHFTRSTIR